MFLKMLLAAVVDDSDSVFVDLLTYADLEAGPACGLKGLEFRV